MINNQKDDQNAKSRFLLSKIVLTFFVQNLKRKNQTLSQKKSTFYYSIAKPHAIMSLLFSLFLIYFYRYFTSGEGERMEI